MIKIVITGFATLDTAIQAVQKGAYDYLPKPFTPFQWVPFAGIKTIEANHSMLTHPAARLGEVEGNPVRADIDEIGRMLGLPHGAADTAPIRIDFETSVKKWAVEQLVEWLSDRFPKFNLEKMDYSFSENRLSQPDRLRGRRY
jgi:CheY-like chemotaxis protein